MSWVPEEMLMPAHENLPEVLAIRGRLDRAGRFTPRRCGSTRWVRSWPEPASDEYVVELLDSEGHAVHRGLAQVEPEHDCGAGAPYRFKVKAYIALRDDAAAVVLRRGETVLWQSPILPAPRLTLEIPPTRVTRDRPLRLKCRFSEPGKGHFCK